MMVVTCEAMNANSVQEILHTIVDLVDIVATHQTTNEKEYLILTWVGKDTSSGKIFQVKFYAYELVHIVHILKLIAINGLELMENDN